MNRFVSSSAALAVCLGVAACGGPTTPGDPTSSSEQKGQFGVSFYVSVSRPTGGTIRSADGKINCGTLGGPNNACAPAMYRWSETATLSAIPDAGMLFQNWAADCGPGLAPTCTLDTSSSGADKWVAAFFNPASRLGHGNILSPPLHAQLFFDFLANLPTAPRCNTCHGQGYQGAGFVPSCNACHQAAGWADWQQSCSFCHGLKSPTTQAGYDFAVHPEWAAPPDDVNGRLTGIDGTAVGAHQAHVTGNAIRGTLACTECHLVPASAIHTLNRALDLPFGDLATQGNTLAPTWNATTLTCASTYCHGVTLGGGTLKNPTWNATDHQASACGACHGFPPPSSTHGGVASVSTACHTCHPGTVAANGAIDVAGGLHVNGTVDASGACNTCHGFPPPSGAHLAHWGLASSDGVSSYGDLSTLETRFPSATPTSAPNRYAFGCGNCHPSSVGQHSMGTGSSVAKVLLYEAGAPAGSLKARNAPTAAFDAGTRTCSGVYCHSSGQATPAYVASPSWTSSGTLGCNGCHANPPSYPTGGAGTTTANTHVNLDLEGWEYGHFSGLPGPSHWGSKHGGGGGVGWDPGSDSAPITCQTCHFDTTDPVSTGTSGFYWLDTTGTYQLPGGDAARLATAQYAAFRCESCHTTTDPAQVSRSVGLIRAGKVLPLRHVNGSRDVAFDRRTALPAIGWLPADPNRPTLPYWTTDPWISSWPADVVANGTTRSFSLATATYDRQIKSCTNVACHLNQGSTSYRNPPIPLIWGDPYSENDSEKCNVCHQY